MQKIARGMWGACRVTSASGNVSPRAAVRSPDPSRSSTVEPSSKATTLSSRTSPARKWSSAVVNVASFIARRTLPPRPRGRSARRRLGDWRQRPRLARRGALAAPGARLVGPLVAAQLEALALLVGHLADDQGAVVHLLLDAVELELALLRLTLPLRLGGHAGVIPVPRCGHTGGRCATDPRARVLSASPRGGCGRRARCRSAHPRRRRGPRCRAARGRPRVRRRPCRARARARGSRAARPPRARARPPSRRSRRAWHAPPRARDARRRPPRGAGPPRARGPWPWSAGGRTRTAGSAAPRPRRSPR